MWQPGKLIYQRRTDKKYLTAQVVPKDAHGPCKPPAPKDKMANCKYMHKDNKDKGLVQTILPNLCESSCRCVIEGHEIHTYSTYFWNILISGRIHPSSVCSLWGCFQALLSTPLDWVVFFVLSVGWLVSVHRFNLTAPSPTSRGGRPALHWPLQKKAKHH